MATIELNGHFRELNRAFSDLVGFSEEEFQAALWPPVMDRANLPKHRQQMNHLLGGRISSAGFDTGYVHAQGLLVPLAGTITLVEQNGSPDHFLLDVAAPG
jgi:PAS domain S-box-containing protein